MGDKEREIISAFDLFSFFHIKKNKSSTKDCISTSMI